MIEIKNRFTGKVIHTYNAPTLAYANLDGLDLREADLSGHNLSRASMSRTNLKDADLSEANLRHATIRNTSLKGASLRMADLRYAALEGTDLASADLDGCTGNGYEIVSFSAFGDCGVISRDGVFIFEYFFSTDDLLAKRYKKLSLGRDERAWLKRNEDWLFPMIKEFLVQYKEIKGGEKWSH